MKKKQYGYNHCGKTLIIIANSKKQIAKHFKVSQSHLKDWCAECLWNDDRKIDLDLTREDALGGKNE